MMRGRFSEEQIVGILKEHEAGRKIAELAREHGVSEATLYGWKSKYGGNGGGRSTTAEESGGARLFRATHRRRLAPTARLHYQDLPRARFAPSTTACRRRNRLQAGTNRGAAKFVALQTGSGNPVE